VSGTKTSCPRLQPQNLLLAHADEPASHGTSSQDHWPCLLAAGSYRCGTPPSACNTQRAAASSIRARTRPDAPPPQHTADRRTTVPGQKWRHGPPPETLESQCQAPGARLPARPGLSPPGPDRALPVAAPRSPDLPWQPSPTSWSLARSAAARTPPHPPADLDPGPLPWLPLPCRRCPTRASFPHRRSSRTSPPPSEIRPAAIAARASGSGGREGGADQLLPAALGGDARSGEAVALMSGNTVGV
jgi:hypothetical protein